MLMAWQPSIMESWGPICNHQISQGLKFHCGKEGKVNEQTITKSTFGRGPTRQPFGGKGRGKFNPGGYLVLVAVVGVRPCSSDERGIFSPCGSRQSKKGGRFPSTLFGQASSGFHVFVSSLLYFQPHGGQSKQGGREPSTLFAQASP